MLQDFKKITFLVGNEKRLCDIDKIVSRKIFDEQIVDFLNALSSELLNNKKARIYADIVAFAFWIRRASMYQEKKKYLDENRLGRGVVFHIAPSNIPVQFAVTMVYALISGNASIIRISEKEFEQITIICNVINELLSNKYKELGPYIVIVKYPHDDVITQAFSEVCDARIIWGGNSTIESISRVPIAPRSVELKFADRYSIAIINSDEYLGMNAEVIANDFYTDTFWVDQNACSSPRLIIWLGNEIQKAKELFWKSIETIVEKKYEFKAISGCEKLLNFTRLAAVDCSIRMIKKDNRIVRVQLKTIDESIMKYKGNCGYFFEYDAESLSEIIKIAGKSCQTVSCCGVSRKEVLELLISNGIKGVDRIVQLGHALDLSLCWDGYDLVRELSRVIQI